MTVAIMWFRRDLRLRDNPALAYALAHAERVIPVYIFAPDEETPWAPGAASRWWLHHSLKSLAADIRRLGSRLILRHGPSRKTLQTLVRETGASAVCWNRLYEPAIMEHDREIEEVLRTAGIGAETFNASLLHEPWTVCTGTGGPYRVFTPFWTACQRVDARPVPLTRPRQLKPPARWPRSTDLAALELLPHHDWTAGLAANWTPGESGARIRLRAFCRKRLADYARNRDMPALDGVSRFSPHLHFGELSPREAWQSIRESLSAAERTQGAHAWLRQLGWREFAHHVLYHFPHTPRKPLRTEFAHFPWRRNYGRLLQAWQRGHTGYPLVDAGMRQLWASGWMHNRVRMVAASFLVKNLRIPWQLGARWFWDTLVDADLANNTLGWQWAAGCGADAAPYFRIFNPVLQSKRFDPDGNYIRRWVPELALLPSRYLHAPWTAPAKIRQQYGFTPGRNYPLPVIDFADSRRDALAAFSHLRRQ